MTPGGRKPTPAVRARPRTALAIAASLLIAGATTADETGSRRSWLGRVFDSSDSFSSPGVSLVVVADIPLPGPLPDGGARLVGERIEIPVAGGLALTGWTDGDEAEILTDAEAGGTIDEWSHDPRGRYRARVLASGKLLMQKKCKCKKQLCLKRTKHFELGAKAAQSGHQYVKHL